MKDRTYLVTRAMITKSFELTETSFNLYWMDIYLTTEQKKLNVVVSTGVQPVFYYCLLLTVASWVVGNCIYS